MKKDKRCLGYRKAHKEKEEDLLQLERCQAKLFQGTGCAFCACFKVEGFVLKS
jgi:hypothetical protein